MTPSQRVCYVFERSLRGKADTKFVKVQAIDLITAFGPTVAKREFGVDSERIQEAIKTATSGRTIELDHEIGELQEMVEAGFQDARRKLKAAQRELQDIKSGKLVPKPLVEVNVGQLRELAAKTREAHKQAAVATATGAPDTKAKVK